MSELTAQTEDIGANALTMSSADSEGDYFSNDGDQALLVDHTNGEGSEVTLTVATNYNVGGVTLSDNDIAIGAGETHLIGPFKSAVYNNSDGEVELSYSDETDIEVAVIDMS